MSSHASSALVARLPTAVGIRNLAEQGSLGDQIYSYLFACALEKRSAIDLYVPSWEGNSLFETERKSPRWQLPPRWLVEGEARMLLRDGVEQALDLDGDCLLPAGELGLSAEEIREALPFSKHLGPILRKFYERLASSEKQLIVIYLHHDETTVPSEYMERIAMIRRWLAQRLCQFEQPIVYVGGQVTDTALRALSSFRPVVREHLTDRMQPTGEQVDYYLMAQAELVISMGSSLGLAAQIRSSVGGQLIRVGSEEMTLCDPWVESPKGWSSSAQTPLQDTRTAVEDFGRRDFLSAGTHLHRALRQQPGHPDAMASMAGLRFSCGDYAQAHHWFRQASVLEPENREIQQAAEVCTGRLEVLREGDFFRQERRSYSLNQLDEKLLPHLDFEGGYFIEAGGNDGISQSNTLYLERYLGWKGLLIEPIPPLAQLCLHNRPGALVENCALVPFDYEEPDVEMRYCNLMSVVRGGMQSQEEEDAHIAAGEACQHIDSFDLRAPARTLTSVLERLSVEQIDLFSLDVEGFELQVLKGLDFDRYRPSYLLVEARYRAEIDAFLKPWYEPIAELSHHDVLYRSS